MSGRAFEYLLSPPQQRRECVRVNDLFAVVRAACTTTEVLSEPRRLDHAVGFWQIFGQVRDHSYVPQALRLRRHCRVGERRHPERMISESIRDRRGTIVGEVSYKGHRYPAEIIAHCVWLYHRSH